MPLYALHVNDADDKVHNYAPDGKEAVMGDTPAGMTEYTGVNITGEPEIGATYDGVTYTPIPVTDYFDIEDPQDTALANGATIQVPADGATTKTLHVQKKKGSDDADMVGTGEIVKVLPTAIIKIDKMDAVLDATDGKDEVVFGPWGTDMRGCCEIRFTHPTLGIKTVILEVTD